jgi:hypothetical protein
MDNERICGLLDRAIELLSPTKLRKLVESYMNVQDLAVDSAASADLLKTVKDFQRRSMKGEYYQSFMVHSKNYMDKSKGTRAWIADCHRHLDGCVRAVANGELKSAGEAFGILFGLLAEIDREPDTIIFFADEAGSWQVGCDWRSILPAWFKCLAVTAGPDDYAENVLRIVDGFVRYDRDRFLTSARRAATADQRKALNAVACR